MTEYIWVMLDYADGDYSVMEVEKGHPEAVRMPRSTYEKWLKLCDEVHEFQFLFRTMSNAQFFERELVEAHRKELIELSSKENESWTSPSRSES